MTRALMAVALTCCFLTITPSLLEADVRADEKSHVEFGGVLGRMVNLFGGKAAREGVTSMVAVKGDRKATLSDATGQIIDLGEEKIYDLDLKKKSYKVTTFAELRQRMEEAQRKAEENARKRPSQEKSAASEAPDKNQKEVEIDFDLKDTNQKKIINGFDTHEVVMTITVREKGKTLEESGGLVLTSDMWMAPKVAAMREIVDFEIRYAQKLAGPMVAGASAEQMAAALAMYPAVKDAIGRMNTENVKMDGTAIETTVTIDAVKSAAQIEQEHQQSDDDSKSSSSGVNSILSGFAKKMAQKKAAGQNDQGNRGTFMTMTSEVLKVTTDVTPADVAVPAGFKESR
jgi:hypothetical protein